MALGICLMAMVWPFLWQSSDSVLVYIGVFIVLTACLCFLSLQQLRVSLMTFYEAKVRALEEKNASLLEKLNDKSDINTKKTLFLAKMSQDLLIPVSAVSRFMDLLEVSELNDTQKRYAHDATFSLNLIKRTLDDIVDITDIELQTLSMTSRDFFLQEAIKNVGMTCTLANRDAATEIYYDLSSNIPLYVRGDEVRFKQILANLLSNAIKFTDKGVVVVGFKCINIDEDSVHLRVSVKDTGCGIDPNQLDEIQQLFSQKIDSLDRIYSSSRLGLVLVSQLVKNMRGEVSVISEVGQGSEFIFDVVLEAAEKQESLIDMAEDISSFSILLVDDNQTSLSIIGGYIEEFGWNYVSTSSPIEAVSLLSNRPEDKQFDLAIIDWNMPEMNGKQLAEEIRALSFFKKMPLVMMITAYSKSMLNTLYSNHEPLVNGFLMKPITPHELYDSVRDTLLVVKNTIKEPIIGNLPRFNKRILLVDDNPTHQNIAKGLLESLGCQVVSAYGGREALTVLEENLFSFDLVFMDIQMPDLDGLETTIEIRKLKKFETLPIVALTARTLRVDIDKCFDVGMNSYIAKPYDVKDLIKVLIAVTKKANPDSNFDTEITIKMSDPDRKALTLFEQYGVDWEGVMNRFSHNKLIYQRSLVSFMDEIKRYHDVLTAHKYVDNMDEFKSIMHMLKGTSASLGFNSMAENAKIIDELLVSDHHKEIDKHLIMLIQNIAEAEHAIPELINLLDDKLDSGTDENCSVKPNLGLRKSLLLLQEEVASNNMHSIETFQHIMSDLGMLFPNETISLSESLNKLRFKESNSIITVLLEEDKCL